MWCNWPIKNGGDIGQSTRMHEIVSFSLMVDTKFCFFMSACLILAENTSQSTVWFAFSVEF